MSTELTRAEVDAMKGNVVLEFGASWCPICKGARDLIDAALAEHHQVKHYWVEDGKGKPLGRSFRVKLWPTLVFLRDGQEVSRVVRPSRAEEVTSLLEELSAAPGSFP